MVLLDCGVYFMGRIDQRDIHAGVTFRLTDFHEFLEMDWSSPLRNESYWMILG